MLHNLSRKLLVLLAIAKCSNAAKILVVPAKDTGSHLVSMIEYTLFLAEHGHSVYLLDTAYKTPKYFHPNLTTITVFTELDQMGLDLWTMQSTDPRRVGKSEKIKDDAFAKMLETHGDTFDKIMQEDWNLVVVDSSFNPHGYAIALRLNKEKGVKFILSNTSGMTSQIILTSISLGRNPILKPYAYPLAPSHSKDIHDTKRFIDRLYTSVMSTYSYSIYTLVTQHRSFPTVTEFGASFNYYDMYHKASFFFEDTFQRLNYPVSESNFVQNTGARCQNTMDRTVPPEVKAFVEDPSSKGSIYVAFGSYINFKTAPERIVRAFSIAMERLHEYRFVFVYNGQLTNLPKLPNVLYIQWTDQIAVLTHPKTKIFISHSGLKSAKEAICSETPILACPIFAEQTHNSHYVVKNGFGQMLNKWTLDGDTLYETLKEMLENPAWHDQVKRVKSIMTDRPISALDAALHYTEQAIRQKRTIPKSSAIDWNAYFYLEHLAILLTAILFIK